MHAKDGWRVVVLITAYLCAAPRSHAETVDAPTAAGRTEPARVLPSMPNMRLNALEIRLNGAALGTWEILEVGAGGEAVQGGGAHGGYWIDRETLAAWRLLMPAQATPLMHRQRLWWPLHAIPGYRAHHDAQHQSLSVEVAAAAFAGTAVSGVPVARPVVSEPLRAMFINYDLAWSEARNPLGAQHDRGLLTEVGLPLGTGVLLSSQILRQVDPGNGATGATGSGGPTALHQRLETRWVRDWPQHDLTLRLGDGWTRLTSWNRQAPMAGLQIGTNRALWPGGAAMATPLLSGTALTPSTVELYVNEALRHTIQVPAGPFTLDAMTPLSGAGEARLVVRDLLGRETVVNRPFFTDPQLLAAGRTDWSLEGGRLRRGVGTSDDTYGMAYAQAHVRHGLSRTLTVESRAQWGSGLGQLGAAAAGSLADRILLQTALAGSTWQGRRGASALVGLQSQDAAQAWGLRVEGTSLHYREAGQGPGVAPTRLEASIGGRMRLPGNNSLGLNLATLRRHGGAIVDSAAVTWNQRVGDRHTLIWSASRLRTEAPAPLSAPAGSSTLLQVMAVIALERTGGAGGALGTAQMQQRRQADGRHALEGTASLQSPVPVDGGWGWRAQAARRSGQDVAEVGLQTLGPRSLLALDAYAAHGPGPGSDRALRATAQGAWVWAEGRVYATRRIQDSFALVEVPGMARVGVGLDGPALAYTDEHGRALLPRLAAYRPNRVRLDPNDVPTDAELPTIELSAVPPWRSGVKLRFSVQTGKAAILTLVDEQGLPIPEGSRLTLAGGEHTFVVGRRGQVYVSGLGPQRQTARVVQGEAATAECRVEVGLAVPPRGPEDGSALLRIGPLVCRPA